MLSINNNLAALSAQNDLNTANSMVTKSISRLSSGLRINSAADDPSGLSISERMRTQIRGLSRAEENAQSATSLIQTAEGALNEVHGMLHRMRELAIQASNGTLTSDDRLEVQHEVESLVKEIDATAKRTEFNTKRLLTGESSALWSASTGDINAFVRGQVDDGSYSLEIHADPGVPQVLQTSVFRIKDGIKGVRDIKLFGQQANMQGNITPTAASGNVDITFNFGNGDINFNYTTTGATVLDNAQEIVDQINNDTRLNDSIIANYTPAGDVLITSRETGVAGNGFQATVSGSGVDAADQGIHIFSGGNESEAGISGVSNTIGLIPSTTTNYKINIDEGANGNLQVGANDVYGMVGQYLQDGSNGLNSSQMAGDITATAVNGAVNLTFNLGGDDIPVVINTTTGTVAGNGTEIANAINANTDLNQYITAHDDGAGNVTITVDDPSQSNNYSLTVGADPTVEAADHGLHPFTNNLGILGNTAADAFTTNSNSSTGGYAIIEFTSDGTLGAPGLDARISFDHGDTWYSADDIWNGATDTLVTDGTYSLEFNQAFTNNGNGANFQVGDRMLIALNDNDNTPNRDLTRVDAFDPSNNLPQQGAVFSHIDNTLDNASTELQAGWINTETGHIEFGTMATSFNESVTGVPVSDGIVTFNVMNGGGDSSGHSRLIDLDRFYDPDGNFILGDHGQYLTIYNGVGDSSTILIDGLDTLEILSDKIEQAIIGDKSDGGLGMSSGDVVVDKHVSDYIDTPTEGTFENQQGSIVIRSPKTDKDGRLYLAANEDLLNALGVSTIQEAKNNEMDITVRDAITGEFVGQDTVSDNRLQGVIEGIDIEFDANYNLNVEWNTATRAFDFTSTDETTTETINIVDNSMDFQIGANEGQMMNAFISQMDAQALGITRVLLTDPEPAQESIRVLDEAIDMVSSERARIGAYANRLEYTMANLAAQRENTTAAESAIRDLDVARETTQLSKSQILSQTSTAMLAQANQQAQGLMSLLR